MKGSDILCKNLIFNSTDDQVKTMKMAIVDKYVDEEPFAICPCGGFGDIMVDDNDYVTHSMIWCDSCGARYIFCPNCPSENAIDIIDDKIKYIRNNLTEIDESERTWRTKNTERYLTRYDKEWKSPKTKNLMKVNAICTFQIYGCPWPTGTTLDDIKEAMKTKDNYDWYKEREDHLMEEDDETGHNCWMYIPVDCYDVDSSNTKGLDTSHDGITVYLKCECEKCGHTMDTNYSGD